MRTAFCARGNISAGEPKKTQIADLQLRENAIFEHYRLVIIVYEGADEINQVDVHITGEMRAA